MAMAAARRGARVPGLLLAIAAWRGEGLTWTMREFAKPGLSLLTDDPAPAAATATALEKEFFDFYPVALADDLALSPTGHLPKMMQEFDWIIGLPGCQDPVMRNSPMLNLKCGESSAPRHTIAISPADPYMKNISDPRTVLCTTFRLDQLMEYAEAHFDPARKDRILVVMDDFNLTMTALLMDSTVEAMEARLSKYFPTQWWLAKDVDYPGVKTQPMGLASRYMRDGAMAAASAAIADASLAESYKTRNTLAAWGTFNPQFDDKDCGGADAKGLPFWKIACNSRYSARAWAESPAGTQAGVEIKSFPPTEYWGELAHSRFILSPLGVGIQSCKPVEALLVLTIPIVQRGSFPAHDDLVKMGFPMVVVSEWEEVTPEALDRWWAELSPKLVSFRKNCLTAEAFWKWMTGELTVCS